MQALSQGQARGLRACRSGGRGRPAVRVHASQTAKRDGSREREREKEDLAGRVRKLGEEVTGLSSKLNKASQAARNLVHTEQELKRFVAENDLAAKLARHAGVSGVAAPTLQQVEAAMQTTSHEAGKFLDSVAAAEQSLDQMLLAFRMRNLIRASYYQQTGQPEAAEPWASGLSSRTHAWLEEQAPAGRVAFPKPRLEFAGPGGAKPWPKGRTLDADLAAKPAGAPAMPAAANGAAAARAPASSHAAASHDGGAVAAAAQQQAAAIHAPAAAPTAAAPLPPPAAAQAAAPAEVLPAAPAQAPAPAGAAAAAVATGKVQVAVRCHTHMGQDLVLVGGHPLLGAWRLGDAVPMTWTEGHVWRAELELPAGTQVEFKPVLRSEDGQVQWQQGDNMEALALAGQTVETLVDFRL